jgi:hypothetical protein
VGEGDAVLGDHEPRSVRAGRRRRGRQRGEGGGVLDRRAAGEGHDEGEQDRGRGAEDEAGLPGRAREARPPGGTDGLRALHALAQRHGDLDLRGGATDEHDRPPLVGERGRELRVARHFRLELGAARPVQGAVGQRGQLPQQAIVVSVDRTHLHPCRWDGTRPAAIPAPER